MQIILLESLNKLGKAGEIVNVKDGYAKNFLIPKNKAIVANKLNVSNLKNQIDKINSNNKNKINSANLIKEKLESKSYEISAECNEEGNLYGAISQQDILKSISEDSDLINSDSVILPSIKSLGDYNVTIRIYEDVSADIKITIKKN